MLFLAIVSLVSMASASPGSDVSISLSHSISEVGSGRVVFESKKTTILPPSSASKVSQAPALVREACTEQFAKYIDSSIENLNSFLTEHIGELRENLPSAKIDVNFEVNIMKTSSKTSGNPNANKCFLEIYLVEDVGGLSVGCSIMDYDLETHLVDFHDDRVKHAGLEKEDMGSYITGYMKHYYWPQLLELANGVKKSKRVSKMPEFFRLVK